jgi:hypothetical protein
MQTLFRTLLLASFAIWFGGFTFYVSFVVPIGTEVLGSAIEQGMITRRVTVWLNIVGAIALFMMILESAFLWRRDSGRGRHWLVVLAVLMWILLVGLFKLHSILDGFIDAKEVTISDGVSFYSYHRVYLWISTIQWLMSWAWLAILVKTWNPSDRHSQKTLPKKTPLTI